MRIISRLCNVDKQIDVRTEPVSLMTSLTKADLIINLNVIHHAGFDFGRNCCNIDDCTSMQ